MDGAALMRRALALAEAVAGRTGANPAVGCVVARAGVVIAEAATAEGGRPHAEEQALSNLDGRGATVFVTLEPCAVRSHGGPSCADLIVRSGARHVVIATRDPHPQGAGLETLRAAGITFEIGLEEERARAVNAAFLAQWGGQA